MKVQLVATVCSLIYFTAESLYMFRVSQHPSSGVLETVTAASGTGHNIGTAASLQHGQIGTSGVPRGVFKPPEILKALQKLCQTQPDCENC